MQHFPVFLNTAGATIVVAGAQECAVAKLRLLLKTQALIKVFDTTASRPVQDWAGQGRVLFTPRLVTAADIAGAALFYAAHDDPARDAQVAQLAKAQGVPTLVVDNLQASDFITPAIVDRDPVTIAIGTEGAAPVLARKIKADIEGQLPASIGVLARLAKALRPLADHLPKGRLRRMFWDRFYFDVGPRALARGVGHVAPALRQLVDDFETQAPPTGHVYFIGAGPGDPDLMTHRARRVLHDCDVVIYDRNLPSAVLELARREATLIATNSLTDTAALLHRRGQSVARLMVGDCRQAPEFQHESQAVKNAGGAFSIIPGVAADASALLRPRPLPKVA